MPRILQHLNQFPMTPKEKANYLVDEMHDWCIDYGQAKGCALIAVNEVLKSQRNIYGVNNRATTYYLEVKKEINNMKQQIEDQIVLRVLARFNERSRVGITKYNTTLERTDLSTLEWLTHAQEEAMDFVLYLERLKDEFKTQQTKDNK